MRTTADYLDALQQKFSVESDYGLQPHTGWSRQQISRYRRKRATFDDATAEKIAGWTGTPLEEILVDMNAQRARRPSVKRAWQRIAAGTVAAILGAITLEVIFGSETGGALLRVADLASGALCIMLNAVLPLILTMAAALYFAPRGPRPRPLT